jgi:hypothetical protein
MMRCIFKNLWAVGLLGIFSSVALLVYSAAYADIRDYKLKAAFIAHFTEFIKWPESESSETGIERVFTICVFGEDPIQAPLAKLPKLMRVGERPIEVHRIDSAAAAEDCDILFVPLDENQQITRIRQHTGKRPVLLINEVPSVPSQGQLISIFPDGDRLRIQIYLRDAQKAGFIISARLLKLVDIVE